MQGIKTRPEHSTVWDPVVPTAQRLRQHLPTSRPDQVVNSVAAKHAMNAPPLAAPSKASQSTSPQPTTAPYQPSNSSLTSRYSLVKSAAMTGSYDRDGTSASATLHSPPNGLLNGPCSLLIRKLPLKTTKDTLRSMVVWSKEFIDAEVLPAERSQDAGFSAAVLHFKTPAGAQEAKSMLDGKPNIANDAQMIVEIFYGSPVATRRFPPPSETATTTTTTSSSSSAASSVGPTSRQPSRFESSFQSLERLSPPNNATYTSTELPNPESSTIYQNLFSPQSPIGNHLNDRTRISGKSLINNDSVDDDETGELLKDPVAYAENGSAMTQPRRSTMPQLPISRLASLSLNTNNVGPQASLSSYMSQQGMSSLPPPHMSALSPTSLNAPPLSYQLGSQHYHRHNFPPVNPADQNPPCNTLYVGNLPIDTSEDELKAMFSKQRGYKRLCFRTKQNGPMCFVEFEDVSFATKALHELYGHPLHNSVKGGIRLSFSKNPLGVRSGQQTTAPGPVPSTGLQSMGGLMNNGPGASFTAVNGPPPGLAAPPGLAQSRLPYANSAHPLAGNAPPYQGGGFASVNGWNSPAYGGMAPSGPAAMMGQNGTFPSSYMMGR